MRRGMQPAATRLRPKNLHEFVGQEHLVGPEKPLRIAIERNIYLALFYGVLLVLAKLP